MTNLGTGEPASFREQKAAALNVVRKAAEALAGLCMEPYELITDDNGPLGVIRQHLAAAQLELAAGDVASATWSVDVASTVATALQEFARGRGR